MERKKIQSKLNLLEAEVALLKRSIAPRKIDFSVDAKNWKKVRNATKKARGKLFRELYG